VDVERFGSRDLMRRSGPVAGGCHTSRVPTIAIDTVAETIAARLAPADGFLVIDK
jgi:hypothetical protein